MSFFLNVFKCFNGVIFSEYCTFWGQNFLLKVDFARNSTMVLKFLAALQTPLSLIN